MAKLPDVSVITVNYNGKSDTCELIESVQKHVSFSYELIVVENASTEDEAAFLKERYPEVICLRSEENRGFSGGNNLGIRIARGKYILLLNNDTFVRDGSLNFLIDRLESNPQTAAVSPKIKFAFSPEQIQFAGCTPLSPLTMRNRQIGFGEDDLGQYNVARVIPYLHGAAMMIKKEAIQKAGLMPEIYFLYYEELDWCTKMKRLGYELYYEPRCTVFHKESRTTGQESPLKIFYMTRNRLLYAYRNGHGILKYLSIAYQLSFALTKNSIIYLLDGKINLTKALIKGAFAFFYLNNKTDRL